MAAQRRVSWDTANRKHLFVDHAERGITEEQVNYAVENARAETSHPIQHTLRRSHYAGLAVVFLQLLGLCDLEGGAIQSMLTGPAGVSGGF